MAKYSRNRIHQAPTTIPPIVHLWLLRLLVALGGHREFLSRHGFSNDAIAEVIGLAHWVDPSPREFEASIVRTELRQLHWAAETKWHGTSAPIELQNNVARLARLVGLSNTDCRILEFAVLIQSERLLDDTAD